MGLDGYSAIHNVVNTPSLPKISEEDRRRAALKVCELSRSREDAVLLLRALGLKR